MDDSNKTRAQLIEELQALRRRNAILESRLSDQADVIEGRDRKQVEQALWESEARFKAFMEHLPGAAYIKNMQGNVVYCNTQFASLIDTTPDQLIGVNTDAYLPPDVQRKYEQENRAVIEEDTFLKAESLFPVHGKNRYWLTYKFPIRTDHERLVGAISLDITERKQAEEALQASEERLGLALKGADLGLWDWFVQTGKCVFNTRWAEMLEYSLEEIEPHVNSWENLLHPDDRPLALQVLNAHLEGKTPFYSNEFRMKTKSGSWKWILDRGKVFEKDNDGKPLRVVGTHLDITERKRAEEELRKNEQRFRAVFEQAAAGMAIALPGERIIEVNQKLCDMLGYTKEELLQHTVADLTLPEDHEYEMLQVHEVLAGNQDAFNLEKRYRHKDGHVVWGNLASNVVRDEQGNIEYVIGVVVDITDRKEVEYKVREANAAKDKFFSIIAHDLRNPIIAFESGMEMLEQYLQQNEDREAYNLSRELHLTSQRLSKFLENLLIWAHSQRGTIPYHPENIEVSLLARYCLNLLQDQAARKQITLACLIEEGLLVSADLRMFETIVRNLLSNAIKFTPKGGDVTVNARKQEEMVAISVADTGVGMSAEKQKKLFDMDENVSSRGTEGEHGTGLGLILCKEFVERHGGQFWVESEKGKGSAFTFTLPKGLR